MSCYESCDNKSDNNEDKVCSLLDDVGRSHVRSRARSRVGSHDHRSCDHGITQSYTVADGFQIVTHVEEGLDITLDNLVGQYTLIGLNE